MSNYEQCCYYKKYNNGGICSLKGTKCKTKCSLYKECNDDEEEELLYDSDELIDIIARHIIQCAEELKEYGFMESEE